MSLLVYLVFCMCLAVASCHETIESPFDLTAGIGDEQLSESDMEDKYGYDKNKIKIWFDNPEYTTDWLDGTQGRSTGDFENQIKWIAYMKTSYNKDNGECKVWCSTALAMKWEFVKYDKSPLDETDGTENPAEDPLTEEELKECTVLKAADMLNYDRNRDPNESANKFRGFNCYNTNQRESQCTDERCNEIKAKTGMETKPSRKRDYHNGCDLCPNVRVKYLCSIPRPPSLTLTNCPVWEPEVKYSLSKRTIEDELQEQAFKLEQKEREILQERDALEMRQMEYREAKEVPKQKTVYSTQTRLMNLLKKYLDN